MSLLANRVVGMGTSAVSRAVDTQPSIQFLRATHQVAPRMLFRTLSRSGAGAGINSEVSTDQAASLREKGTQMSMLRFGAKGGVA